MCTKNYDQMMYCSWDLVRDRYNYFSFWAIFCPFIPLTAQKIKNKNLKKKKKTPGDIIILHICTKNYDQMIYDSSDMLCDGCKYFLFLTIFCLFTPRTAQKIKVLKKLKKYLEISSFYIYVPRTMIRWRMVPEIWCVTDVIIISHFGLFFGLLPP